MIAEIRVSFLLVQFFFLTNKGSVYILHYCNFHRAAFLLLHTAETYQHQSLYRIHGASFLAYNLTNGSQKDYSSVNTK